MKFITTQAQLHAALKRVSGIAPSKTTIPVLTNFLFDLQGNTLRITATDLDHTVVTTMAVLGKRDGRVCLPADKLSDLIRELPSTELGFEVDEKNKLKIKTDKGEYKIAGDDAQDFPAIKLENYLVEFSYDTSAFARNVSTVSFCASTDELRPALMGMLLEVRANELRFVCTDGHRLSKVEDRGFSYNKVGKVILPMKALRFIEKHVTEANTMLVSFGGNGAKFQIGELTLYSRVISALYPNYEKVIPNDNEFVINNIDVAELAGALRRAIIFAEPARKLVRITLANNEIDVQAEEQSNRSHERISVQYDAQNNSVTIGCNADYFSDILTHLKNERILLRFKDPNSAMIIEPEVQAEGEHKMMLLMPIRLDQ